MDSRRTRISGLGFYKGVVAGKWKQCSKHCIKQWVKYLVEHWWQSRVVDWKWPYQYGVDWIKLDKGESWGRLIAVVIDIQSSQCDEDIRRWLLLIGAMLEDSQ